MTPNHRPITLEVCVDSLASAKTAARCGAHRIELNAALELGGLTPSIGLTQQTIHALRDSGCRVIAMVRPRLGGFVYNADDIATMRSDIAALLALGVDGIAFGVLHSDGRINRSANAALIEPILDAGKQAVFHRAFDVTPEPIAALETLIALRFARVLTSGQSPSASQGVHIIRQLIEHAEGRIEVLPGGGIKADNAATLIEATGCDQIHGSFRRSILDPTGALKPGIAFASPPPDRGGYRVADATALDALAATLGLTR
jgi:copper homeostasis protein